MRKLKQKKCRQCPAKFTPWASTQTVCSPNCAIKESQNQSEKQYRKLLRDKKERIKTRPELLKEAQVEFNKFIRLRDQGEPCISCGRHHQGQYHAGHYRTVGGNPELRFNELNCHKQCSVCNNHKSGNIVEYRINLVRKIGNDCIDWLEGPHDPIKLTSDQIREIKAKYKEKVKSLK